MRRKENKGFKIQKILGAAQNSVGRIVSVLVRDPGRSDTCLSVEYAERCDRISSKCLSDSEGTKENNQVLTTTVTGLQISCGFWKIRKKAKIENERMKRELFSVRRKPVYSTFIGSSCVGSMRDRRKRTRICLRTPYTSCPIKSVVKTLHCVASVYTNTRLFCFQLPFLLH